MMKSVYVVHLDEEKSPFGDCEIFMDKNEAEKRAKELSAKKQGSVRLTRMPLKFSNENESLAEALDRHIRRALYGADGKQA